MGSVNLKIQVPIRDPLPTGGIGYLPIKVLTPKLIGFQSIENRKLVGVRWFYSKRALC